MRARLYGFLGPVGVSVPIGGRRRRPGRRGPGPVFGIRTLTDALVRWPWLTAVLWIDAVGALALSVLAPLAYVATVPLALYLVHVTRQARIRRDRR